MCVLRESNSGALARCQVVLTTEWCWCKPHSIGQGVRALQSTRVPQRLGCLGLLLGREEAVAYLGGRWLKQCVGLCVPAIPRHTDQLKSETILVVVRSGGVGGGAGVRSFVLMSRLYCKGRCCRAPSAVAHTVVMQHSRRGRGGSSVWATVLTPTLPSI